MGNIKMQQLVIKLDYKRIATFLVELRPDLPPRRSINSITTTQQPLSMMNTKETKLQKLIGDAALDYTNLISYSHVHHIEGSTLWLLQYSPVASLHCITTLHTN